jgi:hypothetical protein
VRRGAGLQASLDVTTSVPRRRRARRSGDSRTVFQPTAGPSPLPIRLLVCFDEPQPLVHTARDLGEEVRGVLIPQLGPSSASFIDVIGMALLEDTVSDRTGRVVTTSLADYVVAANADVRDVDVLFVGQPDSMTPLGTKGVGELAIVGMAAAIANAVYHATGTRIRSLPISIEKVLGDEAASARVSSPPAAIAGKARSASHEAV